MSTFDVRGARLGVQAVSLIGRACGDLHVGEVLVDELDGRELGVITQLVAYRTVLTTLSSGMTGELTLAPAPGAEPFRVPSLPRVRSA